MAKIVYNACYGGFSLSAEAIRLARKLSGDPSWADAKEEYGYINGKPRHDPVLVQVVEQLGPQASGFCASLNIAEVTSGTPYRIDEYDGLESVQTADSYDWTVAP